MTFTIYPAIDLRHGSVVRLQLGDPDRQTVFSSDPRQTAEQWLAAGSEWLHVVNLDGAFDEAGAANWRALEDIVTTGARVQFGGGLRNLDDVDRAIMLGVERVILGTSAVENPALVTGLVSRFGPECIAVGIDALDGRVRTHGWQDKSQLTPEDLALQMRAAGIERIIFTDISRDGVLAGVNSSATAQLALASGLRVIASGGVTGLDDVAAVIAQSGHGVDGVIIGRALYDGRIDLSSALELAHHASIE